MAEASEAAAAAPASKKEESKEECPWCKYMKGGGCRETFEVCCWTGVRSLWCFGCLQLW